MKVRKAPLAALLALSICLFVGVVAPGLAAAATFEVNSSIDAVDTNPGDGNCNTGPNNAEHICTLRAALEEINEKKDASNAIDFDPTVFDIAEHPTISLNGSTLPEILYSTTINGGSCMTAGIEESPCVGVAGLNDQPVFVVKADNTTISGLAISEGQEEIVVDPNVTGFKATRDWIGVPISGTSPNVASRAGIVLEHGADEAVIGGSGDGERNVIGFNKIGLHIDGASKATVSGNWFGMEPSGDEALPAKVDIKINDFKPLIGSAIEAKNNVIGATLDADALASEECDGGCNVISGAEEFGILTAGEGGTETAASGPTEIEGNYIGLGPAGELLNVGFFPSFEGNKISGVSVGAAGHVTIGGGASGDANHLIGGNSGVIATGSAVDFEAKGNVVGETPAGVAAAETLTSGLLIVAAPGSEGPVIADNKVQMTEDGVNGVAETGGNSTIEGNTISGAEFGISIEGSGTSAGSLIEGNLIEDNGQTGIYVESPKNTIVGNEILRASDTGIEVESQSTEEDGNVIGGDTPALENVISDGGGDPIQINGAEGTRNEIRANRGSGNEGERGFIVLADVPNEPANGVEEPTIEDAGQVQATGKAEPFATVRVFYKESAEPGELGGYLGKVEADESGNWHVTYNASVPAEELITATQTLEGGTSSLTEPVKAHAENPPPPVCPEPGATGCETAPPSSNTSPPPPPDTTKPKVTIKSAPKAKSKSATAKFKFVSNEAGSSFQCKLDKGKFASCKSPKTYKKLKPGKHVFKVEAIDSAGNVSAVVTRKFTVLAS